MNKESIFKALSEPSTYAGLAGLAVAFGLSVEGWETASTALAAIFSAIAVFTREKAS